MSDSPHEDTASPPVNPMLLELRKSFLHQQAQVKAYREKMNADLDDALELEVGKMGVFEKIDAGHYETSHPYPELPPGGLARGMTEEQRSSFRTQAKAHAADVARLNEEFRRDTLAYHGVPEADLDDPFLKLLVELVWDDCCSYEEADYITTLERWMPLYHLYRTSPYLNPRA